MHLRTEDAVLDSDDSDPLLASIYEFIFDRKQMKTRNVLSDILVPAAWRSWRMELGT